jgi:hypothetical protein
MALLVPNYLVVLSLFSGALDYSSNILARLVLWSTYSVPFLAILILQNSFLVFIFGAIGY